MEANVTAEITKRIKYLTTPQDPITTASAGDKQLKTNFTLPCPHFQSQ